MVADGLGIELALIKSCQYFSQTFNRLFAEENPGHAINNRSQRSARTISDDRASSSLSLDRCDAEILFAGEEKSPTMREIIEDLLIGEAAHNPNGWSRQLFQRLQIAPAANDNKRQL